MDKLTISTKNHSDVCNITSLVQDSITKSGHRDGSVLVYTPHTTCAIIINEDSDPDVVSDILEHLDTMVPWHKNYKHSEGNSAAHIKSSIIGCSVSIPIEKGTIQLGTWQGIFLCEFDGPRQREVWVKIT